MNEIKRIASLFDKLYTGEPWIDVNILSTLKRIDGAQASRRVLENCNTIWEILNHLIAWRRLVIARLKGNDVPSPENNFIEPVQDVSEEAWQSTLQRLENSQLEWIAFLQEFQETDLDKLYKLGAMTNYELIHGIIQHDAYHLGQLVILSKLFR